MVQFLNLRFLWRLLRQLDNWVVVRKEFVILRACRILRTSGNLFLLELEVRALTWGLSELDFIVLDEGLVSILA